MADTELQLALISVLPKMSVALRGFSRAKRIYPSATLCKGRPEMKRFKSCCRCRKDLTDCICSEKPLSATFPSKRNCRGWKTFTGCFAPFCFLGLPLNLLFSSPVCNEANKKTSERTKTSKIPNSKDICFHIFALREKKDCKSQIISDMILTIPVWLFVVLTRKRETFNWQKSQAKKPQILKDSPKI